MTPSHVSVNKCDGSCHRSGQTCLSVKTRNKTIPIMFGECGLKTGQCDKLCSNITVVEDVECACGCDTAALHCDTEIHRVNHNMCSCECQDQENKRQCLDRGHVWSEELCRCIDTTYNGLEVIIDCIPDDIR